MRKGQYGRRIEFYTHPKYGGNVPIYLDTTGTFRAIIGDVVLQAETKTEIIKLTDETLKNQTNLEWIPVIEVEFGSRWSYGRDRDGERNSRHSNVELSIVRFWIAQKIDKCWIEAHWDTEHWEGYNQPKKIEVGDNLARLERSKQFRIRGTYDKATGRYLERTEFKLPYTEKPERGDEDSKPTYYVAYTEELWKALHAIIERMDELQKRIIEVLKTEESRARLIADVSKLLPAPPPEQRKMKGRGHG